MLNVSVRPQPAAVAAVSALAATAGKTSSDEILVEQIAAGSKPASYARSLTRSEIDAEDLVHDALVRAYEKRASFRAGHNMRVWLMSIMHNVFIDGTRARRARSWIHMLVFASTLTVTLYAVTDMEYPRLGLIHIENFDHFLVDAHQQMQPRNSVGTVGSGR